MKKYSAIILGVLVAVLLFVSIPLIPTGATMTAYSDYTPVYDAQVLSHHPNYTIREKVWYGFAQGSTLIYLGTNNTGSSDGQYDTYTCWYETASNTWATDNVYTYTDRNGDGWRDTYSNTIAGMDTAGGKWYVYGADYLMLGM